MCGIAGYIGKNRLDRSAVDQTLPLMKRRGPDTQAARSFENEALNVYLLHARLSIIDLDPRSSQPFQRGNCWLSYNGEIYNYLEVRKELELQGCTFKTQSDTEVLAAALEFWGVEALDRLEGMWAFAWYDSKNRKLLLSRDRFGEKPLYYCRDSKGGLYFGSEIKFMAALKGSGFSINENHLMRYLVNGYKSLYKQPANFFSGVEEVQPGCIITVSEDLTLEERKYWAVKYQTDDSITFEKAVVTAREKLIRSVELRLRSDVPLAFCMSGGVDSNALISIARRELGHDVHGFTIINTDERYAEQEFIEASVKDLGIKHTAINLKTDNFLPRLRELIRHHDAPVYTATFYVYWLLQEAMAERGYKISISGTAADELFSGYYDHHGFYLYDIRNEKALYERSLQNWREHIGPIVRNPYLQDPEVFVKNVNERGHIYLDADLFREFLIKDWHEDFFEKNYRTDSILKNRMLNELFHEATPVILHEDDSNAMYFSIENRSPFLDRDLFEYTSMIPARHLIRNGAAKAVLRESLRGIVPDIILDNRRKVGFNVPIGDLLDLASNETRQILLEDSPVFEFVKKDKIADLINEKSLANSRSKFLFYFVNAKLFLEEYW